MLEERVPLRTPHIDLERRVLVLPPTGADAVAIDDLMALHGISCYIARDMHFLCAAITQGAGAVVVSEEALIADHAVFLSCTSTQPVWSDLPLIVLSKSGVESAALAAVLPTLGNVSVLERPMRTTSLVSVVRSCLIARARQYQVREHLLEEKRVQRALREAAHTERAARSEAERAGKMKDEFLATLSHELRTPLHAILGWSQIMRKVPELPPRIAEGLTVIERNSRSQAKIISDLLDMSSIISGKVRLDMQPVELANVLKAAADTARPAAQAKDVVMNVALDPIPLPVRGDPNRLQQVFWNLIANAVKFTPQGGQISVGIRHFKSHLEINVEDTGLGIDAEFLPHVFDRFRQADASATRAHGGLGLGLSIVKQLVEMHGGVVSATSAGIGKGSIFTVTLPTRGTLDASQSVEEGPLQHLASSTGNDVTVDMPNLEGFKLLVVDDEADARSFIARMFEDCRATVLTAASVNDAIALLGAQSPDLLISDIGMPGQDGYELIRRIRGLGDAYSRLPAIALTAYARAEDRRQAIEAGYQMHLPKPVEPAELIGMVTAWHRQLFPNGEK